MIHPPPQGLIADRLRYSHWQLRSLISAENKHIVYLPGGASNNHVQRLNTKTRECETIRLLSFVPRCLVAQNGWVCCGSEYGDFSAIRLDDVDGDGGGGGGSGADADGSPIDIDPEARLSLDLGAGAGLEESLLAAVARSRIRRSNKTLIAKSMPIAEQRVNCITLWFPPTDGSAPRQGAYAEPVAVLANNDKTVTIVSLREFENTEHLEPIDVIKYPDFVNRAIISSDGGMLVAILDDPYMYVHQREASGGPAGGYTWDQKARWLLKSQRRDDISEHRGSFAACFSNSGTTLAVGTQYGTISIFDACALTDVYSDPFIASFRSSRPDTPPGAIRDMAFCPGSNDLLAWTEDRGRVGIADTRSKYMVLQVLDIAAEEDFEHVTILDRNTATDTRGAGTRLDYELGDPLVDALRLHSEDGLEVASLSRGLSNAELMLLEGLQNDRLRASTRITMNAADAWRILSPRDADRAARRGGSTNDEGGIRRTNQRSSSLSRALETLNELRQRMRHDLMPSNASQPRTTVAGEQGSNEDRLHGMSPQDEAARNLLLAASRRQYVAAADRLIPRLTPPGGGGRATGEGSSAANSDGPPNVPDLIGEGGEGGRRNQDRERRDRDIRLSLLNRLANRDANRDWIRDFEPMVLLHNEAELHDVPPMDDNTSGLAWSDDGDVL